MLTTGHRMNGQQNEHDERTLPSRERCEKVLKEPNRDVTRWQCRVCGDAGSRAHWIAEHVLHHLNFPERRT
jgi:hypothetical protein